MSVNHSYTRFRSEGRSGADTFARLYSRENCIPRPGAKPQGKKPANLRDLLSHDKKNYSRGAHSAPSKVRMLGEKVKDMYAAAPEPVRVVGGKIGETAEKVYKWRHLRTCARIVLIITVCALCFYSLVLSMGFRALAQEDILSDLSANYSQFKGFKPKGGVPSAGGDYDLGDLAPLSPSDLSGSDAVLPSENEEMNKNTIAFASESDIIAQSSSRKTRVDTVFKAGLDSFSAMGTDINLYAKVEAGTESLDASVFSGNGTEVEYVVAPTREQLDTAGCHTLRVRAGGKERNVLMVVVDTKSPTVTMKKVQIWLGDSVEPSAFISDTDEPSPLVVTYSVREPDFTMAGEQVIYLDIQDICGNKSEMQISTLTIIEDTEPPVISGAKDRTVIIGEAVSYKQGVTATDNRDGEVKINVDSSAVDPTKAGKYEVIYTATDKNGNVSSKTVTFRFGTEDELNVDIELEKQVEKVAKKIFKADMTDGQKIKAIYNWCRNNIAYSGHSDKSSWKKGAINGFKKHSGDCYTYFACSKALFEYCGIENIDVVKVRNSSSESRHYWSLVDVGTGYYHFDATPRVGGFNGFMRTDKQLKNYSSKNKNSHRFDATLYPATPTESYGS